MTTCASGTRYRKHVLADPGLFVEYYGNPLIHVAGEAWLGPYYQITAQVNNVRPGSAAQASHRDYHLGFQSAAVVTQFPSHAQVMSQYLTLQGAVAHCDIPSERGATMLLPFSHQFDAGYLCYCDEKFATFFRANAVQPTLSKGDLLFFSPAVFHAGGANRTSQDRIVNLLQISSAFGKTMESLDFRSMIRAVYPILQLSEDSNSRRFALRTICDSYPFPTNLDRDPPTGNGAPPSQHSLVEDAMKRDWSPDQLEAALAALAIRRRG